MQTTKMSLANIKGKLSRTEMKNIMAGSGGSSCIADGQACEWFTNCCNVCAANFYCKAS